MSRPPGLHWPELAVYTFTAVLILTAIALLVFA